MQNTVFRRVFDQMETTLKLVWDLQMEISLGAPSHTPHAEELPRVPYLSSKSSIQPVLNPTRHELAFVCLKLAQVPSPR